MTRPTGVVANRSVDGSKDRRAFSCVMSWNNNKAVVVMGRIPSMDRRRFLHSWDRFWVVASLLRSLTPHVLHDTHTHTHCVLRLKNVQSCTTTCNNNCRIKCRGFAWVCPVNRAAHASSTQDRTDYTAMPHLSWNKISR